MKRALNKFYRDERGVVVVMIGAIIALLLVFSVMAIDATQMMLVRTQLQNAADAGALAGALLYAQTGDTTVAQDEAILAAGANNALLDSSNARNTMSSVVITDADVTFPQAKRIVVTTHRTEATGDQFLNYFMRIFDENNLGPGNMTATAAAEFAGVCGSNCLKPWGVPDRWCDSSGTGDCNDGDGVYEPLKGEYYDPVTTGYLDADVGVPITIVTRQGAGNDAQLEPEYYSAIRFPGSDGASDYRAWIAGCVDPNLTIEIGDTLDIQGGAQAGNPQAVQAVDDIIQLDRLAYWDVTSGTIISDFPRSPRIVKLALIDPNFGIPNLPGGQKVLVVKIVAMFLESAVKQGNEARITGRFMYLAESDGSVCDDPNTPTFLYKALLVQ